MASKEIVSRDYVQEVLKRWEKENTKEGKKRMHKQAVTAGKEFVNLYLWLQALGAKMQADMEVSLAGMLKDYPEALKIALAYYNKTKDAPALGRVLIEGFVPKIIEGALLIQFNWRSLPDNKVELAVNELKQQGEG